jgi:hypothetical protein
MDNKEILPEILESSPEVTGAEIRGESDLRVPELTPVGPTTSAASPVPRRLRPERPPPR